MNILITGASGLIGTELTPYLQKQGHQVMKLTRNQTDDMYWRPEENIIHLPVDMHIDTVIHLAGENIAEGRWNKQKKQRIRSSRVEATALLARTISALEPKPKIMLSASGIGFYGDRGDRIITESDPAGVGFLADVSREWEAATRAAETTGIRVVHMRIAPVLSPNGGMLKRMLPAFRLGLGATLGSGKQYMSWITIDDVVRAMDFLLQTETLEGPVNLCTPHPVSNREFTKTLGRILHRPAVFRIPHPILKILFGELADKELVASSRAIPDRLIKSGFKFEYPELEKGLHHLLGKSY